MQVLISEILTKGNFIRYYLQLGLMTKGFLMRSLKDELNKFNSMIQLYYIN